MFHQREVLNIQRKVGFVFNEHCSCSLLNVHVGKSLLLVKALSDMSLQTKRRWRMRSLYFKPEISLLSNHCFHHVMTIRPGMGVNECFCKRLFLGYFLGVSATKSLEGTFLLGNRARLGHFLFGKLLSLWKKMSLVTKKCLIIIRRNVCCEEAFWGLGDPLWGGHSSAPSRGRGSQPSCIQQIGCSTLKIAIFVEEVDFAQSLT